MLWRERERSLEEKISWDPAGNRTWTLYDTGDIGGPQTVYSMLSGISLACGLGTRLTLTIQYTVYPQWLRELM